MTSVKLLSICKQRFQAGFPALSAPQKNFTDLSCHSDYASYDDNVPQGTHGR
jgi:hypothetical protein